MDWQIAVLALIAGYLVGALSFARIVSRRVDPTVDVTSFDSMPGGEGAGDALQIASATTVGMRLGPGYGMLTGLLDILKVLLPALALKLAYPGQPYFLLFALAAMVGHVWPIYYRFRGGRGLSAMYGGMLAADWLGVLATWLLAAVVGFGLRNATLIFVGGTLFYIPWVWLRWHDPAYLLYAIGVNVIFAIAMIPEAMTVWRRWRAGIRPTFAEQMEYTPMGRQLYHMAQRMRLVR